MKLTKHFCETSWFQHMFYTGEKATAGVAGTLPNVWRLTAGCEQAPAGHSIRMWEGEEGMEAFV